MLLPNQLRHGAVLSTKVRRCLISHTGPSSLIPVSQNLLSSSSCSKLPKNTSPFRRSHQHRFHSTHSLLKPIQNAYLDSLIYHPSSRLHNSSNRGSLKSNKALRGSPLLNTRAFANASGEHKHSQAQSAKSDAQPDNAEPRENSEQETPNEGESGSKDKTDDKKTDDQAPPPPHGDKTPWQVFTETLRSEFKASKEWNESTKALASSAQDFTQNETVKRARSAYSQVSDTATTRTSAALKTTGKTIGQGAAWAWDTSVVQGVRKGANAVGSGIEKATRPVRETEAFKNVKDVIDDGSSSRYGGWTEKEERRKRREQRELNEIAKHGGKRPNAKLEEDPDAGTNVTLHKDAAWKESWRDFRDTNRVMQSLFSLKSTYKESENPLISTARSISDRVAGFFAENETAMVIKKFREMDPNFQLEPFLQEMREYMLPEVLDAYVKGDLETLRLWLSAAQYQVYSALMQQYTVAGLKSDGRILDIRHVDILSARILDPGEIPVFIVTCRTQEVHVYRKLETNELAAGMEDKVQQVTYAIGVTRIADDVNNPETRGWRLIELQKSGRDYI